MGVYVYLYRASVLCRLVSTSIFMKKMHVIPHVLVSTTGWLPCNAWIEGKTRTRWRESMENDKRHAHTCEEAKRHAHTCEEAKRHAHTCEEAKRHAHTCEEAKRHALECIHECLCINMSAHTLFFT